MTHAQPIIYELCINSPSGNVCHCCSLIPMSHSPTGKHTNPFSLCPGFWHFLSISLNLQSHSAAGGFLACLSRVDRLDMTMVSLFSFAYEPRDTVTFKVVGATKWVTHKRRSRSATSQVFYKTNATTHYAKVREWGLMEKKLCIKTRQVDKIISIIIHISQTLCFLMKQYEAISPRPN